MATTKAFNWPLLTFVTFFTPRKAKQAKHNHSTHTTTNFTLERIRHIFEVVLMELCSWGKNVDPPSGKNCNANRAIFVPFHPEEGPVINNNKWLS